MKRRLKIFTWNVHGGYLNALVQTGHNFYIPVKRGRPYGYSGKSPGYLWPSTVHEVALSAIKKLKFDVIIFQIRQQVQEEQFKVLSKGQRVTPSVFIFHTPPMDNRPRKEMVRHWSGIESIHTFVHITNYNRRQWGRMLPVHTAKTLVIYHGIPIDKTVRWVGDRTEAVTAINELFRRSECGVSIWKSVSRQVPCVLIGGNSERLGGIGVVQNMELRKVFSRFRVYFNPTTNSSVPMAMLEAMSAGLPVVSMASTEIPRIIKNGVNGYVGNTPRALQVKLRLLVENKSFARQLGKSAQRTIREKFSMERFTKEWNAVFRSVVAGCLL